MHLHSRRRLRETTGKKVNLGSSGRVKSARRSTGPGGQPAGAGGTLGIGFAAKSPPDDYTILIATASIAVSPSLYAKLGYDPITDLAPVARLTSIPNVLLVHPSVPAKTLRQFVELARARPGAGRVRPLAVLTEQRIASLPDVPTGIEAGVRAFTMPLWYGMFAPAGTPPDIVSRLNRDLLRALETPELRDRLAALGVDPWPGTPEDLGRLLRADIENYGKVVRAAGLPRQ